MADLSPAAQAIMDAYQTAPMSFSNYEQWDRDAIGAVLRELAKRIKGAENIQQDILDIATELDNKDA